MQQIVKKPTSDLIPYINNARTHSDQQVLQIAASIKEFGFTNPVLIDGENGIIAGHGRVMAAQKLGMEEVPTIELSHLSETQKKAYILADNKLALNAGWDEKLLNLELAQLKNLDYNIELIGFTQDEIDAIDEDNLIPIDPIKDKDLIDSYSKKIKSPVYEVTGDKPEVTELFDTEKTNKLIAEIESTALPEDEKRFLKMAAYRHTVFNYQNIAEFYAHSDKRTQELMEKSALVIIDFNQAIENGFVKLSTEIAEAYKANNE